MAEMHLCDHLEELWSLIDEQYLLYLVSSECPGKIGQREKLEGYIRDYLCVAPHNRKFTFPETAQVLHKSASNRENFTGYKAAQAWKAIGKYADNLVVQPWRKEFKDLKLYCGFYKHEVEENLSDAELMFEAMGYCHVGNSTMAIADIIEPGRIMSVSKDAIIAYVECQILKQIWDSLSPYYNFTWLEILEFRENHTGTPDHAVRSLRFKRRQRQCEEQMQRRAHYQAAENHRPEYAYGANVGYYNHMHYPGHPYTYPAQSRFSGMNVPHVVSPTSMYPPPLHAPYVPQHAIKPQDLYPMNGYHMHSHYLPQEQYSNYHSLHPQQSSVPTAQLIELDSTPVQNNDRPQSTRYSEEDGTTRWQDLDKSDFPSWKAKDDGAGSWENWDYVYRNLEIQGYKKNLSSRGEKGSCDAKAQGEITEKIRKMNIGGSKTEGSGKSETDDEPKPRNKANSPEKGKRTSGASNPPKTSNVPRESEGESESAKKKTKESEKIKDEEKKAVEEEEDDGEKWECISCTYLNSSGKQICDMCCRSKEPGDEARPQPTGGQVCPNCTLVNERGLNFCVACGKPLKGSPTYI